MRTYLRLLEYVLPYWRKLVLLFVTVTIFAALGGFSLTLIHPFLRIILDDSPPAVETTVGGTAATVEGIPWPGAVERCS